MTRRYTMGSRSVVVVYHRGVETLVVVGCSRRSSCYEVYS
jgi:hypothetical protein